MLFAIGTVLFKREPLGVPARACKLPQYYRQKQHQGLGSNQWRILKIKGVQK